jgi:hypothetical protein
MAPDAVSALVVYPVSRSNPFMKHAGTAALDRYEPLLKELRKRTGLKEKSRGCFYLSGRAFLHFHEHGEDELYADVRIRGSEFDRVSVSTGAQQKSLLRKIDATLGDGSARSKR